jgi:ABC-type Mn2+/Zn2+ transport system permease subunit
MSLALGITMAIKIKKYRSSKKEYLFSNIVNVPMKKTLLLFICLYSVALFSQDDMFAQEEVNPEEFSEL